MTKSTRATDSASTLRRLTAREIFDLNDRVYEDVEVPEWGALMTVQSMTGQERDRLESEMLEIKGKSATVNYVNLRARTLVRCVVDENHELIFSVSQVAELGRRNASALERLYVVANRLSGLTKQDVAELTINLGEAPSDEGGSD